jgi:hypothetical protein
MLQTKFSVETTHALDLNWVGVHAGKDGERESAFAGRVGHALTEVSSRSTHPMGTPVEGRRQILRAASFEGADRVQRFDLNEESATELLLHGLRPELRGVEEYGFYDPAACSIFSSDKR